MVVISSLPTTKALTDSLWIKDGIPTKINLCIAHNFVAVTFISIEFREVLEEKDVHIRIKFTQASKTVCMGYLLDFAPSMVDTHWCKIVNKHPKLATIEIDIKHEFVKTSSDKLWELTTSIKALHIFSD